MKRWSMMTLSTLVLLLVVGAPLAAAAQSGGPGGPGENGDHRVGLWDKLSQELNLNPSQQTLLEGVKTALRNYLQAERAVHRATHEIFKAECAQTAPNFDAAGQKANSTFQSDVISAHEALTAAKVAFYKSLTPEQRQKIANARDHGRGRARIGK